MEARQTLEMLHLTRNNYAAIMDDRPSFAGMLKKAQDYVTYGEPSKEIVALLIRKKGRLAGNKKLTDEYAQTVGYKTTQELGDAVYACSLEYWKLPSVEPVFRLHPPTKGFRGKIKKSYRSGGELGYRGARIDALLKRML